MAGSNHTLCNGRSAEHPVPGRRFGSLSEIPYLHPQWKKKENEMTYMVNNVGEMRPFRRTLRQQWSRKGGNLPSLFNKGGCKYLL